MSDYLPNLFIAGVPKAGTSSLFTWLNDHPNTLGSHEKETCFFADPDSHTFRKNFNIQNGMEGYRDAFPERQPATRTIFEATPTYIYSKAALQYIPDLPSSPRCLFILRDPATQIRSVFRYFRDNWDHLAPDMAFNDFIQLLKDGSHRLERNELTVNALANADYGPWLHDWQSRLGSDRIKVCTFDRLCADPKSFVVDIAEWCGLDPSFYDQYDFPLENETYTPKNRLLHKLNVAVRGHLPKGRFYQEVRRAYRRLNADQTARDDDGLLLQELREQYAPTNRRLAADFDVDLSGWMP